jgi:hypothetical protein
VAAIVHKQTKMFMKFVAKLSNLNVINSYLLQYLYNFVWNGDDSIFLFILSF